MNKEFPGVFQAQKKDKSIYYRASITYRGKHISLGSFDTEDNASAAYKDADSILKNNEISILDVTDSPDSYTLSFEKCIVLINFRDNGLYIANPIYISPKMIYYYLSPDEILKFDADELFYYSEHKIMKRGNHLFVSDYGKQVNIVTRYSIKNHAVIDKDYRFKNGDRLDFRTSNLEIFNIYQGVSKCRDKGTTMYKSVIHIGGNYTVGHYYTQEEAAIAYNKAAHYLENNGIDINFNINIIHGLSQRKINEIYKKIIIPDSIKSYVKKYGKDHPSP